MAAGSVSGAAPTLATTGTTGAFMATLDKRVRHHVRRGLHQRAVEGRGDGQHDRALGALGLGDLRTALDGGLGAGDHHLAIAVVVGGLAHLALRGFRRGCGSSREIEAEQGRHGAGAHGRRTLHRLAADPEQARRIGKREGAVRRRAPNTRPANGPPRILPCWTTVMPCSASSTRITAMDTAIRAGWAFSVSVSSASGPSHIRADSFWPSAASTSSKTARAAAKFSASALAHADRLAALARET